MVKSTSVGSRANGHYAAFLRGINVGGKNKLPMKDLAALFAKAGCTEAQTYIQSGNVAFRAPPSAVQNLSAAVEKGIVDQFGFRSPVVVRAHADLVEVTRNNPFLAQGGEGRPLHVAFLSALPDGGKVAKLDPNRSAPDAFAVVGPNIYLFLPNGVAKTKLTNDYFDRTLGVVSTVRNWRTVLTLMEMTRPK